MLCLKGIVGNKINQTSVECMLLVLLITTNIFVWYTILPGCYRHTDFLIPFFLNLGLTFEVLIVN